MKCSTEMQDLNNSRNWAREQGGIGELRVIYSVFCKLKTSLKTKYINFLKLGDLKLVVSSSLYRLKFGFVVFFFSKYAVVFWHWLVGFTWKLHHVEPDICKMFRQGCLTENPVIWTMHSLPFIRRFSLEPKAP